MWMLKLDREEEYSAKERLRIDLVQHSNNLLKFDIIEHLFAAIFEPRCTLFIQIIYTSLLYISFCFWNFTFVIRMFH